MTAEFVADRKPKALPEAGGASEDGPPKLNPTEALGFDGEVVDVESSPAGFVPKSDVGGFVPFVSGVALVKLKDGWPVPNLIGVPCFHVLS